MSSSQPIKGPDHSTDIQPTPQNTPLDTAVLANRPANLGKPQVEDIGEGDEDDGGMNPASLLSKVGLFTCLSRTKIICARGEMRTNVVGWNVANLRYIEPSSSRSCPG
jgi:nucleosome assembly protein 1-like 1